MRGFVSWAVPGLQLPLFHEHSSGPSSLARRGGAVWMTDAARLGSPFPPIWVEWGHAGSARLLP